MCGDLGDQCVVSIGGGIGVTGGVIQDFVDHLFGIACGNGSAMVVELALLCCQLLSQTVDGLRARSLFLLQGFDGVGKLGSSFHGVIQVVS